MSEMQANQYFIARRFKEAKEEYLKLPIEKQNESSIKGKLIICSAVEDELQNALSLLLELVQADFNYIYKINNSDNDFGCQELIDYLGNINIFEKQNDCNNKIKLGIIYFFIDNVKAKKIISELKNTMYTEQISSLLAALNRYYSSEINNNIHL